MFLKQRDMLSDTCNVILVSPESESETSLQTFMSNITEEFGCRANTVAYVPDSIDLFPDIGDNTDWIERQLYSEEPEKMSRPFFLTNAIIRLVSLEFAAVSQTVIHVSDTVNKFS